MNTCDNCKRADERKGQKCNAPAVYHMKVKNSECWLGYACRECASIVTKDFPHVEAIPLHKRSTMNPKDSYDTAREFNDLNDERMSPLDRTELHLLFSIAESLLVLTGLGLEQRRKPEPAASPHNPLDPMTRRFRKLFEIKELTQYEFDRILKDRDDCIDALRSRLVHDDAFMGTGDRHRVGTKAERKPRQSVPVPRVYGLLLTQVSALHTQVKAKDEKIQGLFTAHEARKNQVEDLQAEVLRFKFEIGRYRRALRSMSSNLKLTFNPALGLLDELEDPNA